MSTTASMSPTGMRSGRRSAPRSHSNGGARPARNARRSESGGPSAVTWVRLSSRSPSSSCSSIFRHGAGTKALWCWEPVTSRRPRPLCLPPPRRWIAPRRPVIQRGARPASRRTRSPLPVRMSPWCSPCTKTPTPPASRTSRAHAGWWSARTARPAPSCMQARCRPAVSRPSTPRSNTG